MTDIEQIDLMPGVCLTAVHTKKFKSAYLALSLMVPLDANLAAGNALIPSVLRRGTARCPDMEDISAALDELCGGSIEPIVRKKGETQCVGFVASFLDDAYSPDGGAILEPAAALLGELLLQPVLENGGFRSDYVERERKNLVDRIRAQMNDKRQYATLRLVELMCQNEAFGTDRLGSEKTAAAITGEGLWAQYQALLATAKVELYYCGSADFVRVEKAMRAALKGLPARDHSAALNCEADGMAAAPRFYEEALDVTQGKLTLGFRTDGACISTDDYPALVLLNALFGGTTTSKLFLNVREKRSLCYYASSQVEKHKGLILVSSGVEFAKRQEAQDEILAQMDACKQGIFEPWELEAARRSAVSSLATLTDSQGRQEDYWLGLAVAGLQEPPEALAARLEAVTGEQVVAMANRLTLDTIYFLKGREAASVE